MATNHKNVITLGQAPIKSLLWKYFLPAFTGMIINSLYNIVDRIFIGQGVGALALSGISAVFPIMLIIMGFGMLIGLGAGVRISLNLGKNDLSRAEKVLGNAFILMILISLFITALGFQIKVPLLQLFGIGPQTIGYANEYLDIILMGTIFQVVGFSLNNLIRAEGNAKIAMYSMLISAGINIILDPIFIFVFKMGVEGAAWATIISQFVLCIWVIRHFISAKSVIHLKSINFRLSRDIIMNIITIGFAPFSMQIAASFVQGAFNTQLATYSGDLAIAAMGIINSVSMLIIMSIVSINMAAQPIFGFNYGANNYSRVKETLITCIIAATGISILGFCLVELFPHFIINLFNRDSEQLQSVGVKGLRIFLFALPIIGFQIITGNYFQSTGKAKISAILSLLRQVIILLPVLLILPRFFGLTGVWIAAPIADCTSAIITLLFLIHEIKRLNRAILTKK